MARHSTQGVAGMQTSNASGTHHNLGLQPVQHSTSQHITQGVAAMQTSDAATVV
jgi:hypothetical protein